MQSLVLRCLLNAAAAYAFCKSGLTVRFQGSGLKRSKFRQIKRGSGVVVQTWRMTGPQLHPRSQRREHSRGRVLSSSQRFGPRWPPFVRESLCLKLVRSPASRHQHTRVVPRSALAPAACNQHQPRHLRPPSCLDELRLCQELMLQRSRRSSMETNTTRSVACIVQSQHACKPGRRLPTTMKHGRLL